MNPLTLTELEHLAAELNRWAGGRLQEFKSGESWFEFGIYKDGQVRPLFIDLNPRAPVILPLPAPAKLGKGRRTPTELFIRAHFMGQRLEKVEVRHDSGRVMDMLFSHGGHIEVRLFPRGQNLICRHNDKKISAAKILPLPPAAAPKDEKAPRSVEELCAEYLRPFLAAGAAGMHSTDVGGDGVAADSAQTTADAAREKALRKKLAARDKMRADLEAKKHSPLRAIGEWMKAHQSLNVPSEWAPYVDARRSFAENLQDIFNRAKELEGKIRRAEERLKIIDEEIAALRRGEESGGGNAPAPNSRGSLLKDAQAKGRTRVLTSGHQLFLGKSGADNLRILRAASAWDYWLHLKDEPGSHAILRRQKGEAIADRVFLEALQQLVRATYGEKAARRAGEKFDGLIVECRYVRPIKGDRLGRVTYKNERVLPFVFKLD